MFTHRAGRPIKIPSVLCTILVVLIKEDGIGFPFGELAIFSKRNIKDISSFFSPKQFLMILPSGSTVLWAPCSYPYLPSYPLITLLCHKTILTNVLDSCLNEQRKVIVQIVIFNLTTQKYQGFQGLFRTIAEAFLNQWILRINFLSFMSKRMP